jgi:glycosyltransferase involved in cell wall biosynthesis
MKKVILSGPVLSRSGYGEHIRFVLNALLAKPEIFDIYVEPTVWGKSNWIYDDTPYTKLIRTLVEKTQKFQGTFDLSIQVKIPNEFRPMAVQNIGVTAAIETDKCSPEWIDACNKMDRVIVTSKHSRNTIIFPKYNIQDQAGNHAGILESTSPVEVVGYPVKNITPASLDLDLKTDFNFLTIAQFGHRKNLENLIQWFCEEFKDDENVGIVVKAHHVNNSTLDHKDVTIRLQKIAARVPDRKCKIYLVHGNMSEEEIHGLYNHDRIKCYITATHGEGFGLPIFEAAYSGLPVVAPAFSGHLDFLYMPVKNEKSGRTKRTPMFSKIKAEIKNVQPEAVWDKVIMPDAQWAFPVEDSVKKEMRSAIDAYSHRLGMANKLKEWTHENFSQENQLELMTKAILGSEYDSLIVDTKDLPKISILTSVYKGDKFIEHFLEDMTRQTIFNTHVELIMVDANSPGNEKEVIDRYVKKYPKNIKYFKLEEDPGIYGTWNYALSQATGEYITNANLDDRKAPHSLERHAKELYMNPDVSLVYADSFITKEENELFENNSSDGNRYKFEEFSKEAMLRGNQPHNNPMWRKSLHDSHGPFDPEYKSAGDWEFFLRCTFAGEKFQKINEVLGLYMHNPEGVSTNPENFAWKRKEERKIYLKYKKESEQEIII